MINFKNKNILITGASGGIGQELVKKFISLGGNVIGSGTKIEKLNLIKKKYPNIKIKKFNLSEHSKIEEFINGAFLELGGLDILINNAGINVDNLSLRMKEEEWNEKLRAYTETFPDLAKQFNMMQNCELPEDWKASFQPSQLMQRGLLHGNQTIKY